MGARSSGWFFGLLTAMILAAPSGTMASGAEDGHRLAEVLCARCHAIDTEGPSPLETAPPLRDLARQWPPDFLAEALAEGIGVGHDPMPEFTFEPDQISDLIAYLETLRRASPGR